ncbi:ABC transporter ATP-binding protein [Hymenobacter lutimineralis]|uniref:ABC transporter ATP-binding protein n=1 Tax=Hymenobacter lutimineralis TaxID=2606448 RepID=A0A5D6V229_9BACT|nr:MULTISPECIES: ABC transporter ATP-binding protein [Hymenobacter]QIX62172.1 ABC transporter ATP-binding protein [Hymenobacter sp. BT18]TYZ10111.1 ABC transporter ATP-binding protein [Hymenobacter lutimineralis]
MELVIDHLSKTYPNGTKALNDVSLRIAPGMFGLLGPNGAGKSSLMRTISTLQQADAGTIQLGDIDVLREPERVRQVLGYLPQEFGVYPKITAAELLEHFAVLKGLSNKSERRQVVDALLQQTNLYQVRNKNLGGYSGGMKQRFGIAQALLGNPKLIIVDEPTAGLDPTERNRFHNLLAEIGEDRIVILSTHIVSDVSDLCRQFAIINKGQVLYTGDPLRAMEEVRGQIWRRSIRKDELATYQQQFAVISSRLFAGQTIIHVHSLSQPGNGFEGVEPTLEDVYFARIHAAEQVASAAAPVAK